MLLSLLKAPPSRGAFDNFPKNRFIQGVCSFAISGICFAASCICNLSKFSLGLGAGIPLGFYLIQMMSQISEDLDGLKYVTLNTLFDPDAVVKGDGFVLPFLILAVVGLILYAVGILVFREKDLPL